jgi:hypothetical protein
MTEWLMSVKGESKQQAVKEEIAIAVNARKTGPVLMV